MDEVCIGKVVHSSEEGSRVSIGFFNSILIPSFWMLRSSHFDPKVKLWVWTPEYDCVEGNNGNVEELDDRFSVRQEEIVKREEQEKYTEEQANGAEVTI